jgi:3-oxoacyl-[acyl-carrier protein] reductase
MPVAVVTGSSSGIGRATAIRLAQAGYGIVLHAHRNLARLFETASQIRQRTRDSVPVLCITADIADARASADLVAAAFLWQSRVDVWVNNAGADVLTGAARQLSFESRLQQLLAVDVMGTIRLSRLVAARMAMMDPLKDEQRSNERLPSIINMSWDQAPLGMEGEPGQLFGTCKTAVAAFSQSLALSVNGIRVNCVAPGWIKTAWGEQSADDYWTQRAIRESQLARWGTPQDVAETICWLTSPASQFVNGQTISINGGRRFYPERNAP